jgi:hypothetical protein
MQMRTPSFMARRSPRVGGLELFNGHAVPTDSNEREAFR